MRTFFTSIIIFLSVWFTPAHSAVVPSNTSAQVLTASDLDSWLSGFMAPVMETEQLAGAVVVVVKDGKVLLQRGYGYADMAKKVKVNPETTMFRPGSISKLFSWTAVMQLVEKGKIDLDADINKYLDFTIVGKGGKPITVRHLLTHRAGFQELGKNPIFEDQKLLFSLEAFVKRHTPARIFEPGAMPAYSNYGASLAGYIVQRVSGMTFDTYIERHIFAPLEMNYSTFRQPLPPRFLSSMSKGYGVSGGDAQGFEMMNDVPAGGLSASGADMAKFMIAHLESGSPILKSETTHLMHTSIVKAFPQLPGMALGFYQSDVNGHRVIAHSGDLVRFHSDLSLFLDDGVGIFISMNSEGCRQDRCP